MQQRPQMNNTKGIPVLQPPVLVGDPMAPSGSPQPILQFKELTVDRVRYDQWKASLAREKKWRKK